MKTNRLLSILLLAVSMVSCTTYYQVKTRIHPDGSAHREVYAFADSAFMAGDPMKNHFFSMERASSFFFPAFSGLMPSSVASMALACLDRLTACLNRRVGICFLPVLLALSPRSKSGYFSTI